MQEIIKISQEVIGNDEQNAVNARELHGELKAKRQFANWIRSQIDSLGLEENIDYISFNTNVKRETGATTKKDYIVTLDTAKHIAMASRTAKGKEVRQYFIRAEKKLRQVSSGQNDMIASFIQTQQQTNETMLKLLEMLVQKEQDKPETLTKEQMRTVKNKIYLVANPVSKCHPGIEYGQVLRDLYSEISGRMGVTSYYDILREDYDDAIFLLDRAKDKWDRELAASRAVESTFMEV